MRGGCVRRFMDGAYLLLLLILYNMRYTMPVVVFYTPSGPVNKDTVNSVKALNLGLKRNLLWVP